MKQSQPTLFKIGGWWLIGILLFNTIGLLFPPLMPIFELALIGFMFYIPVGLGIILWQVIRWKREKIGIQQSPQSWFIMFVGLILMALSIYIFNDNFDWSALDKVGFIVILMPTDVFIIGLELLFLGLFLPR